MLLFDVLVLFHCVMFVAIFQIYWCFWAMHTLFLHINFPQLFSLSAYNMYLYIFKFIWYMFPSTFFTIYFTFFFWVQLQYLLLYIVPYLFFFRTNDKSGSHALFYLMLSSSFFFFFLNIYVRMHLRVWSCTVIIDFLTFWDTLVFGLMFRDLLLFIIIWKYKYIYPFF